MLEKNIDKEIIREVGKKIDLLKEKLNVEQRKPVDKDIDKFNALVAHFTILFYEWDTWSLADRVSNLLYCYNLLVDILEELSVEDKTLPDGEEDILHEIIMGIETFVYDLSEEVLEGGIFADIDEEKNLFFKKYKDEDEIEDEDTEYFVDEDEKFRYIRRKNESSHRQFNKFN